MFGGNGAMGTGRGKGRPMPEEEEGLRFSEPRLRLPGREMPLLLPRRSPMEEPLVGPCMGPPLCIRLEAER